MINVGQIAKGGKCLWHFVMLVLPWEYRVVDCSLRLNGKAKIWVVAGRTELRNDTLGMNEKSRCSS